MNITIIINLLVVFGWMNPSRPIEQRVDELIKQMTVEEKVGQMMNDAPAIDRLGVPAYNWWNECLHGVARAGIATVYPQAIGLAATFDDQALYHSASIISDEARAKHSESLRHHSQAIYEGLTFWSPNINIFRDPRWGRGQETYGEDPYLTAKMGVAFVKGLQGDNPKYLKLVATAKHFSVHSGPEYERHVFDAFPSDYDLWDTYLPAFKALVDDAHVASVMCAYNRLNGTPCCGSDNLLVHILRDQWNFKGYVVSDCGAIDDFYRTHRTSPNAEFASKKAVIAGTDLECGNSYTALLQAVKDSVIREKDLDVSLHRLFYARFKLGMFDQDSINPYAQIPYSVVDSKAHQEDALNMARESIVLLKNENNLLPLSQKIKKIAVIGPAANDSISLLGNYNGDPSKRVTILQGIKNACDQNTQVVYYKGVNLLDDQLFTPLNIWDYLYVGKEKGLKAEYYKGIEFRGSPILTRMEHRIQFQGGVEDTIATGIKAHWVSIRWSGYFIPVQDGDFTFRVTGDDGFRLFLDDKKVIDHFSYHEAMTDTYILKVVKGGKYKLRLEYFQGDQGATIYLAGGRTKTTNYEQLAQRVSDADVIVFAGGISPSLEGEEMPIDLPGFKRGDRTSIELPSVQTKVMKALEATGKPVIFVMQTGSALAINWEKEHIPAIINLWYGGEAAGTALADVLFGKYNPAGRLPITFYKSLQDLPPFDDYSMEGRTYRYCDKDPLFPFGFGLSYTHFTYNTLQLSGTLHQVKTTPIKVSVVVTNDGNYDGDEVAQLYLKHNTINKAPLSALKGFQRVHLKKGASKLLTFYLSYDDLSLVDKYGNSSIAQTDQISIFVGGGQKKYVDTTEGSECILK